jgi:hypothetical protein
LETIFHEVLYTLRHVPAAILGLGAIAVGAALGALFVAVAQRRFPVEERALNNEVAGFKFGAIAAIYGVILAFAVVAVWERFEMARSLTEAEADSALSIARLAYGFEHNRETDLRDHARAYLERVVAEEWPSMERGNPEETTSHSMGSFYEELARHPVTTLRDQVFVAETLARLDRLSDSRRRRIEEARVSMPHLMWLVLVVGAMITIGFSSFFGMKNRRAQIIMTGLLGATVTLALYTIFELDHPFTGSVRITADAYERALEAMPKN